MSKSNCIAIDVMAIILPPSVYPKWVEGRFPHVPKVTDVAKVLKGVTLAERKEIAARVDAISTCTKIVNEAIK